MYVNTKPGNIFTGIYNCNQGYTHTRVRACVFMCLCLFVCGVSVCACLCVFVCVYGLCTVCLHCVYGLCVCVWCDVCVCLRYFNVFLLIVYIVNDSLRTESLTLWWRSTFVLLKLPVD